MDSLVLPRLAQEFGNLRGQKGNVLQYLMVDFWRSLAQGVVTGTPLDKLQKRGTGVDVGGFTIFILRALFLGC